MRERGRRLSMRERVDSAYERVDIEYEREGGD